MKFITRLVLMLTCMAFISCKDNYNHLSADEKAFLVYESGDNFKLKNLQTNDTTVFTVTSKSFRFEDSPTQISHIFGSPANSYDEVGTLDFVSETGCTGQILVSADHTDYDLNVRIKLEGCFGFRYYQMHQYLENDQHGIGLSNYYLFLGDGQLFFTKEHGIIRMDNFENEPEFIAAQ